MSRPSTLPRWAVEADGTPATNITEPASGDKDTGWLDAAEPPAEYFNWMAWLTHEWIKYFSAPRTISVGTGIGGAAPWTLQVADVPKIASTTTGDLWIVPIAAPVGETIEALRARVKSGGATSYVGVRMFVFDAEGTTVESSTEMFSATDGSTDWETIEDLDPLSGHVFAAGEVLVVYITARGAGSSARHATSLEIA